MYMTTEQRKEQIERKARQRQHIRDWYQNRADKAQAELNQAVDQLVALRAQLAEARMKLDWPGSRE